MGDVVVFQPAHEIMVLRDKARKKAATIMASMLLAARQAMAARGDPDLLNDEVMRLQEEYNRWQQHMAALTEVIEHVEAKRAVYWRLLPNGEVRTISIGLTRGGYKLSLTLERKYAAVLCSDLRMFEKRGDGGFDEVSLLRMLA